MISVRDAFFNKIYDLVKSGEDIVIVTPDLGAPSLDEFRKNYPEKYVSVGIAEQNMISVAAGICLSGQNVIAYGLNPFPVTRAYDQIRSLMAELGVPITLCALNAGLCSAECGYTHMPVEDIGMMRMLSGIQIINPSDATISEKLANNVTTVDTPRYIRFDKAVCGYLYEENEIDMEQGFTTYGIGGNICIITYGYFVSQMRAITDELIQKGCLIKLIDLFSLPVNQGLLLKEICKCRVLLVIEETVLAAGIGSYMLELISDHGVCMPIKRIGLNLSNGYYDVFTDRDYIQKDQGMDQESIRKIIVEIAKGI